MKYFFEFGTNAYFIVVGLNWVLAIFIAVILKSTTATSKTLHPKLFSAWGWVFQWTATIVASFIPILNVVNLGIMLLTVVAAFWLMLKHPKLLRSNQI